MIPIYSMLAVAAGSLFAIQGPVNTALGKKTNPFFATTVSFFGGLLALVIMCALDGFGTMENIGQTRLWMLMGGLYGAFGVCVSIAAIPVLGVALTLMVNMLGQLLTGVILDYFGWMGVAESPVTALRIAGIVIVAIGIYLIFLDKRDKSRVNGSDNSKRLPMLILAFAAGAAGGLQSPTNAAAAAIVGSLEGTLISFAVGFTAIAIVTAFKLRGNKLQLRGAGIRPWMVIGGIYGVAAVYLNLICVKVLGAALLTAGSTLGQLLGGVLVDSTGIIRSAKVKITALRICGITAVGIGVVLVTIARLG